jgi:hypothetical protein
MPPVFAMPPSQEIQEKMIVSAGSQDEHRISNPIHLFNIRGQGVDTQSQSAFQKKKEDQGLNT